MVPYYDGEATPATTSQIEYTFIFGWCQKLSDIDSQTLCSENIMAGRLDGAEPTAESQCVAYSGGDTIDDIDVMEITGDP